MAETAGKAKRAKGAGAAARPKKAARPARPARPARATAAVVVAAPAADAAVVGQGLKRKDLLDRVAAASGRKPGEVREIVEATLAVLGAALERGEALNLPPLGKARVAGRRGAPGGETLVVRLRRPAAAGPRPDGPAAEGPGAPDPLAQPDEEG